MSRSWGVLTGTVDEVRGTISIVRDVDHRMMQPFILHIAMTMLEPLLSTRTPDIR